MNICIISRNPKYAISYSRISYDLAKELALDGHNITFIGFGNTDVYSSKYLPFVLIPMPEDFRVQDQKILDALEKIYNDGKFPIADLYILVEDIPSAWLLKYIKGKNPQSKTLMYTMFDGKLYIDDMFFNGQMDKMKNVFNKDNIDTLIVPTKFSEREFNKLGIEVDHIVPLYADSRLFKVSQNINKPEQFTYLSVSRNTNRKNLGSLIIAFSKLNKKYPDTHLRLRTEPHVHDNLSFNLSGLARYLITHGNISFDKFTPLNGDNLSTLLYSYNYAHCGVYPSSREGWCLPALESLMSGLPIIVTENTVMDKWVPNNQIRFHADAEICETTSSIGAVITGIDSIYTALEKAYHRYKHMTFSKQIDIRRSVLKYDISIFMTKMKDIINNIS